MGVVPPRHGFLEGLRRITQEHDALLILDEVITGFRVAYGGAQERYGVQADITCLGKVIGGGLPVGAYGGKREIMEQVAPLGPMYQAGTLSGNPLAVTAGIETLKALQEPGVYAALEQRGSRLEEGLVATAREVKVSLTVNRVGSMLTAFFHPGPVDGWEAVNASDREQYARFFRGMLQRGVYLAPSPFEAAFISLAHSADDMERAIAAAGEALGEL
jgi:glutamate-1-semialdehyde 2,1-aminomutase